MHSVHAEGTHHLRSFAPIMHHIGLSVNGIPVQQMKVRHPVEENVCNRTRTVCKSPRCNARRCAMSHRAMRSAAKSAAGNRRSACSSTASAALTDGQGYSWAS